MNRYVTALLFFIAVLIGIFVVFVQPHLQSSRDEEIRGNFLLSLDPDHIRSIRIHNGDDTIQIDRHGTNWEVGSKVRDRASPEVVANILETAKNIRIYDKISASEFKRKLDIKNFGLKWPRQRFDLIGDSSPEICFGNDAAISGRVYVRKQNSQSVYLVSNQLQTLISYPLNTFRDRQLTQWAPNQIRNFVLKRGGSELEVQQTGSFWKISRPLDARADSKKIYQFLDALLSAPILEFVDDDNGDLSRFGIDDRSTSITFKPNTGESPAVLRIGARAPGEEGGYYAQFTARESVVRLPASAVQLLEVNSGELRERSLFPINPDVLDCMIIRSGTRLLTLNRKGEDWKGQEGNLEFPVTNGRIQKFLSSFEQQGIKKFLTVPENTMTAYGLDQPWASIEFYSLLSENTPETSAGLHKIGAVVFSSQKEGIVYAQIADSSEVLVVDSSILSLISAESSNWK